MVGERVQRRLAAILAADVVGYSLYELIYRRYIAFIRVIVCAKRVCLTGRLGDYG